MPVMWSPDTCKCKILYDQKSMQTLESHTNKDGKIKKTIRCEDHAELDLKTELLQFVTPENQSCNEFYTAWTEKELTANGDLITQYKKDFRNKIILEPIRGKSLEISKSSYALALADFNKTKRF